MRRMQIRRLRLLEEQDKRLRIWYTLELTLPLVQLAKQWGTHLGLQR